MNATLEAMARALFQSWFVDFDPVRAKLDGRPPAALDPATAELFPDSFQESPIGHIPTGWEVAELGQIADVIDCLHAKKPERCENGQLYLQLNNIRDAGLIDTTDSFFVSAEDYRKWISRMEAVAGDCVITNVGRVGAVGQIPEGVKAALGRNITGIRCKADFPFPTFLIECLLSESMREEIRLKTDSGTILDALNVKSIPKLRFARPSLEIGASFEKLARPLRRRMEQNLSESRTLATLRDTLLPKLLSGELRVGDAAQQLEKAM
jgi:type I restriction enzyme S subunit